MMHSQTAKRGGAQTVMTHRWRRYAAILAAVALAGTLAGCAASQAFSKGNTAAKAGEWDVAVDQFRRALEADPKNPEYRIALQRAMGSAAQDYAEKGRVAEARGQLDEALRNYRRASEFDPQSGPLAAKVSELDKKLRTLAEQSQPKTTIQQLREAARQAQTPALFRLNEVLPALNFVNASPRDILTFIGQLAGINVQFDAAYNDPQRGYTMNLEGVTLEQALNAVTQANLLFYKVTNPRTVLVANDTQPKRAQYDEQVVKLLRLSHADATEVAAMVQQVVRITGGASVVQFAVTPNKTQNSIMVRAAQNVAQIIERIVEIADTPRAEVVIEVEILEVRKSRLKQYGLDLGNYTIGAVYSPESDPRNGTALNPPAFNLNTPFRGINRGDFYLAVPSAAIRFLESDSQTKLLAKTQLRGSEGQKLTLNLGEDVPVPSTVFTPIAQGGANVSPLSSFNYRTVGIVLEATPRVTYEDEVMIDMNVENSTRAPDVNVGGTNLPSFSTRKVTGQLRLRDGEPNLLAGLLQENDRRTLSGFPGILHLPVIKQLFSANDETIEQTDIIMLMTPRIIRSHELTQEDLEALFIGTTSNLGLAGGQQLIAQPPVDPALTAPGNAPAGAPGALPGVVNPAAPRPAPVNPTAPPGAGAPAPLPPATPPAAALPPATPPTPSPTALPGTPLPLPPGGTAATANTQPGGATGALGATGTGTQIVTAAGQTDLRVGSTANIVAVNAVNATRLSQVSLTLTYNPAALRVRSVQQGSFMGSAGSAVAFTEDHNTPGRIDMVIMRTGDTTGAAGNGLLASILFDAVGAGAGNIAITGTAAVPGGAPQTLQFAPPPSVTVR